MHPFSDSRGGLVGHVHRVCCPGSGGSIRSNAQGAEQEDPHDQRAALAQPGCTAARLASLAVAAFFSASAQSQSQSLSPQPTAVGMAQIQVGDMPVTLVYPSLRPARSVTNGPFDALAADPVWRARLQLDKVGVPVDLLTAGRDTQRLPKFPSNHVLRHCTACTRSADPPGAGHIDLLSPWPAPVAKAAAAVQARGGYPEPGFDGHERDAAVEAIARFFVRQLAF